MPRDGNGNYTLPAGNPVVPNTTIASAWANDTMNDLAKEMQDSFSRSGKGALTAPLGIVDFSGSVPGLNFTAEPTTGLKRFATEDVRLQVTTTEVLRATKTGVQVLSGGSLKDVVVEEPGQGVMRGQPTVTVAWFWNNAAPPGWVIEEPDTNLRELITGPAVSGGTVGGSVDPTNLTQTATVTVTSISGTAQDGGGIPLGIPVTGSTGAGPNDTVVTISGGFPVSEGDHTHSVTGTTDAVPDHQHTVTGTGAGTADVAITPRYARGILAKLT